ncbi:MAG: DNA-directed RNA polymerase subunit beta, partial [Spirochaetes bacterium]
MVRPTTVTRRIRKNYGKIKEIGEISNLIDVQLSSYAKTLQADVPPDERKNVGLQAVFNTVFPIKDIYNNASLEFVSYRFGKPKYDESECLLRGITYAAPLKVTFRLVVYNTEENSHPVKAIKEQEVYFGEIPLMTKRGTFIINGTERVIVSQLHRSPGVFFDFEQPKTSKTGKPIYLARIIPYRGSWIDLEFDQKDILYVRIDRRRKLPVTVLLKALGYSTEEILDIFYEKEKYYVKEDGIYKKLSYDLLVGQRLPVNVIDPKTKEVIVKKNRKITKAMVKKIKAANVDFIPVDIDDIIGKVSPKEIVDPKTQEIIVSPNETINEENFKKIVESGITEFELLFIDNIRVSPSIRNTLAIDKVTLTPEEKQRLKEEEPDKTVGEKEKEKALFEIYRRLRPGDPPTMETATTLFYNLFFNPERYDLSNVGRMKLNHKLGLDCPLDVHTLRREDILEVVKYLVGLREGRGQVDDIDHLGNRRVRTVGELLENKFHTGLLRPERAIRERMNLQEIETLMPHDLINSKPLSAVIKEFFGSSQLSQFMDQTNPLSEITHKRRLSALGPGGLTRERAGFEVRDVHPTHYGRICPIETPEGPNIGLISSLATYARINEFGFIETPYRKVVNGKVTDEVVYLFALDEEKHVIAQANARLDEEGRFIDELVSARKGGEFTMVKPEEVDLMDLSPKQLVSIAASLIPFLEHDDANRALMGSNMQRQAVPLLRPEAPFIGTGMESIVARDSGVTIVAKRDGVVKSADASRIVVKCDDSSFEEGEDETGIDIYQLIKYQRSNQDTCINQHPIVKKGDRIKKGEIIADGPATEMGELALGRNVLVAFMPWSGYNFEDSILVSEKLLKEDVYTSIHIEEFEAVARETKLGREEITRDIPNVGEESLVNLDESGIIRIGAEVKSGDILVGKVTPKGETQLSPEEKLLRAIFGEKAGDVRDTSLKLPHGTEGIVIDVKIFSRKGIEKDSHIIAIEEKEKEELKSNQEEYIKILKENAIAQIFKLIND